MKKVIISLLFVSIFFNELTAQSLLEANGENDTYALINDYFAPGYDILEVPDCSHSSFGSHIDQVYSKVLNKEVFRFHVHKEFDDDQCQSSKAQRNEIKADGNSPINLLGNEKETITYNWKFKLDVNFAVSAYFTHLHQLEAVGGTENQVPLITLTAIQNDIDQLELRYSEADEISTLATKNLESFKGKWLTVTETVTYGEIGAYEIHIETLDQKESLLHYKNDALRTWRTDADFIRPKWGIHRSLASPENLRDELLLMADLDIQKSDNLSLFSESIDKGDISIFPNPTADRANIKGDLTIYDEIVLCNSFGKEIAMKNTLLDKSIDVSRLNNGIYFVVFKKDKKISAVKKLLKF